MNMPTDDKNFRLLGGNSPGWRDRLSRFPTSLLILLGMLILGGFVVLYSAVGGGENIDYVWRQAARAAFGLTLLLTISMAGSEKIYRRYAYLFYGLSLLLLIGVFLSGTIGMGARRWLEIGVLNLQPSELMKVALVLALARYFHDRSVSSGISIADLFIPLLMIALPTILIVKQPDLGTSILLSAVGMAVIVAAGLEWKIFIAVITLLGASMPMGWNMMHDYQRRRILTLFSPEKDPLGAGYHIIQSKIAIGSGGIFGKGFMAGSQSQLNFLPERHTDFIFSVLAEEWGFVGGLLLLITYCMIILRTLIIASTASDRFGLLSVVGLTALFAFQVLVNMGMVIGLLPVVGIPLPMISYGGSSMLTLMMAMGLIAHVSIHSKQHGRTI
ncbi:MAG: rod shape-determining protein RodA [Magnetococcales bacterium]|nr:rod shape-determining protein RodA [Magnetococcales bacterium]MBF0149682.1 rod shape-determining protein RodA [Magnetococcales bacterium]MBF0173978.1 rod shape-determining protein RodA [Magnetococcales bacterium]MBF0346648.1 rod shape-determining protein RodA [Magnetococcales bacterium]MBF0630732.1 rod shape-determining protein RodA [Magnetococcales bacterium]